RRRAGDAAEDERATIGAGQRPQPDLPRHLVTVGAPEDPPEHRHLTMHGLLDVRGRGRVGRPAVRLRRRAHLGRSGGRQPLPIDPSASVVATTPGSRATAPPIAPPRPAATKPPRIVQNDAQRAFAFPTLPVSSPVVTRSRPKMLSTLGMPIAIVAIMSRPQSD